MKRLAYIFSVVFLFLILAYGTALAANMLKIVLPKDVTLDTIGISDYENGYKEKIRATVLLMSDTSNDWKLMVRTNDGNMGTSGNYIKPISDLNWRASGSNATQLTYTSITNYDVEAARGIKSGTTKIVYIDYKVMLAWNKDIPGVYNIAILYTLTTQ